MLSGTSHMKDKVGLSGGEGHLGLREQEVQSMDGEPED